MITKFIDIIIKIVKIYIWQIKYDKTNYIRQRKNIFIWYRILYRYKIFIYNYNFVVVIFNQYILENNPKKSEKNIYGLTLSDGFESNI